jgi:glycine cleavage system H protein
MKFSETHEWIEVKDEIAVIGITHFAQKELGEIVYVELPKVGKFIKAGEEVAVLESTKAAADVYSPASGKVIEVNERLKEASELINQSPEEKGWIFKLQLSDPTELDQLMDFNTYQEI